MHHKGGRKKITLETIQNEMRTMKKELIDHMDKRFDEHEVYFTAIQGDLIELKGTTKRLEERMTRMEGKQETTDKNLSEFRTETKAFHSGMAGKSGRQDAAIFRLTGILEAKNILSSEQSAGLRTL